VEAEFERRTRGRRDADAAGRWMREVVGGAEEGAREVGGGAEEGTREVWSGCCRMKKNSPRGKVSREGARRDTPDARDGNRETLPETRPLPRARFCAESQIPSSRHRDDLPRAKGSALGTQKTRGREFLCREGTVPPLGTGAYSRHRESVPRAAGAGPRHRRHLTAQRNGRHGRLPGRQMCREPNSGSRHRAPVPSA
jgi:hypothetical protein